MFCLNLVVYIVLFSFPYDECELPKLPKYTVGFWQWKVKVCYDDDDDEDFLSTQFIIAL